MRRLVSALTLLAAVAAQLIVTAVPAHAYEVHVTITGAGRVTETTSANLVGSGCVTSATNPTGTIGAHCYPGDPAGDYGWGWVVRYVATPMPGYRFVRWQSDGSANPVVCDGAPGPAHILPACQFATHDNLQVQAIFVDDIAPIMSSLAGPNNVVHGPASFTFSAAADPTFRRFECQVPGVHSWQTCSPGQSEDPGTGTYTFQVRAVDWSGNLSAVQSWGWTVDKVLPETTLAGGPAGITASRSATFSFSSNEAGTFLCTFGGVQEPCGSPKFYGPLADGTYTFAVRARDVAGNIDQSPATRTWTVDTVRPTVRSWTPRGKRVARGASPAVTFSEPMRESTVEAVRSGKPAAFYLTLGGRKVAAKVALKMLAGGTFTAVLDPKKKLMANKRYKVVLTSAARDLVGNALIPKTWTFRTKK